MRTGMMTMTRIVRSLLALVALIMGGTTALADIPRWIGPVAETATSRIFAPAILPGSAEEVAMRRAGYVQEEYFLSGSGNIYSESADGSLAIRTSGVGYTTRLVIVRPRDLRKFNGIVQLGFTHPSLGGNNWSRLDALVLRSGMAYAVLVTGGDAGTRERSTAQWPASSPLLFKWYDAKRYAAFDWPTDDGIRWDVMGQAATALRQSGANGPLKGAKVRRVYMSGWSFLGSIQRSFINFGFHDRYRRADGSPVIDGYLLGISAGSVGAGHVPLNSADPVKDRTREQLRQIDVPVIELTSEMEAITNVHLTRPESDVVMGGYRIYELGGTSHRDTGVDGQIRPATLQLLERRHPGAEPEVACTVGLSDVPMRDIAQAALVNLDRWVSTGKAPPRAARMQVAEAGKAFARDSFGNPLGGVRVAQLDVPLVGYGEPPREQCGGKVPSRLLYRLPLRRDLLAATYPGGRAEYLAKFNARLAELVKQGWLLASDAAVQRQRVLAYSARAFPAGRGDKPAIANGTLLGGAKWRAEVPENWNGTLLLWSRGYSPKLGDPELGPAPWHAELLAQGYALAASDYGAAGWALEQAVPAQRATVAAFTVVYGKPKRTIGWGNSMGGLVTTALVEQPKPVVQGGVAMCPSIGGAVGMMNMGLDGAFVFRTLAAPAAGLELTGIRDDMANSKRAGEAVAAALKTPEGRARLALAGVLGGLPDWSRPDQLRPAALDYEAQVDEMGATFVMGIFMPRADQEARAGGLYSWNSGIDYGLQLDLSQRRELVEELYRKAELSLAADLEALAAAARIKPSLRAREYMLRNYTPTARPNVPLISLQTVGDGATSPSLQQAYTEAAPPALFSSLWLAEAGHCRQGVHQAMTALRHLEARLDSGAWPNAPVSTVPHKPAPMLRPCFRGRICR